MALNIKDPETEQLAADVASLAGESKTAAIRQALRERRQRLVLPRDRRGRAGQDASAVLVELLASADAIVIEFGQRHWREAVSAWGRFGKGRDRWRDPAGLNLGDCLTYATALVAGEALLAKGDDFTQTDIP